MNTLRSIIRQAIDNLQPRQKYAADVIRGKRLWSGADLQGKARKYGGGYARQRDKARDALEDAGGIVIPVEHGRLETAAPIGCDDYGNALAYIGTLRGRPLVYRAPERGQTNWRRI